MQGINCDLVVVGRMGEQLKMRDAAYSMKVLSGKRLYHSVFDLFPLTYVCVDIDFCLFSD